MLLLTGTHVVQEANEHTYTPAYPVWPQNVPAFSTRQSRNCDGTRMNTNMHTHAYTQANGNVYAQRRESAASL